MSPAGPYALSAQGIESSLRLMGVPRHRWPALIDNFKALQAGALQGMAENQPKAPQ